MERRTFLEAGSLGLLGAAGAAALDAAPVKALVFDVFGTVVDWRSSIIREGRELGRRRALKADWEKFADAWRSGYGPAMDRVRKGELGWTNIDALHRMVLDRLLGEFRIEGLTEAEKDYLNRAWHRLDPWPDAVEGLTRLKRKFIIATLSNGNVALLTNMAKHAGLPWDCILSSELARRYKPDREVYQMAADLLGLRPEQVMMVAAHKGDLRAARGVGLKTGFVPRPLEHGPGRKVDAVSEDWIDVTAKDFIELAKALGA
jgi:2-haloacid dehalogenase